MHFPKLIKKEFCKIPVTITLYSDEITEDGAKQDPVTINTYCNYQSTSKVKYTEDNKEEIINGILYFSDDILPSRSELFTGEVVIFDETRMIADTMKARNPDGSVNYTRIDIK